MALREASLLEREREFGVLERLAGSARSGAGGVVVVEGPPGIGKSSLLAIGREVASDLRVLGARGGELEREFPFGIVRQLLEPVLAAADGPEREGLLAGAAALGEPVLVARNGEVAAEPAFSALHGLYWLVVNLAEGGPLLVVVDDVQWADLASLRWLVYLGRRLEGVPVGLLLATRPAEAGAVQELLDELVSIPGVELLQPRNLSEGAAAGLVGEWLRATPDPEFVAACHAATGGNPFLLRELLGELVRRGVAPSRDNAEVATGVSSQGVGRAVRSRLRPLGSECAALARAVAVLGDPAEPWLAARLAGLEEAAAAVAGDRLAGLSILEPGVPLSFVHAVVRSSVEAELSGAESAALHERAAALLAESGAPADRIGLHLLATAPRANPGTVETLWRAATDANGRGAPDAAAAYLRRALREPPTREFAPQLLRELGSAELRTGEVGSAVEHLTAALGQTTEPSGRARVALELAGGLMFTDRAPDAVDVMSDAIDELPSGQAEVTAQLIAMRAVAGWSSVEARRHLPSRPERAPPGSAEGPRTIGERLLFAEQAMEEVFTGTAPKARSLALLALGEGELLEVIGAHNPPLYLALNTLIFAHAVEDAERHVQALLRDARRRGSEGGFVLASHFRAAIGWRRGVLAEVEADAHAALDSEMAPHAVSVAAASLADALVARGDPEAAAAQLRLAGLDAGTPAPLIGVLALVARAHVRLAQQAREEALAVLFECGRQEDAWGVVTPSLTSWRAEAAVLLAQLGEPERADGLAAEAVRRADAFGSPFARGIALRAAALVAQPTDHDGLAASVTLLRGSGARLELARSLVELGCALRRAGRRPEARDRLREGLGLAAACGADALARRAHDELVAAGARPRRDPTESRSRLTASELRVARMASDGMTNREVAQALFLTENTIETHLRSVYRKLEINSRTQLARAL